MQQVGKRPSMRDIKEQFRLERHQEFLAAALRIVTAEGLGALTMQGLADELDCGIGTLYRHFASKGVLIAELQREALDIVSTSFLVSQTHLDDLLTERGLVGDPAVGALARAYAAARFWVAAETTFPQEIDLSRRMFVDPVIRIDDADASRVLPAAMGLLDTASQLLEEATSCGALAPGPSVQRAVVLLAGTTGVLLTSALGRWDPELFEGGNLATLLVNDLFRGWGADPERLVAVADLIAVLAERGHLVPAVRT